MSTDNQQTKPTIDEENTRDAAKLRFARDLIEEVARNQEGTLNDYLHGVQHGTDEAAAIIAEEAGEITPEEFEKRVFPRGGRR